DEVAPLVVFEPVAQRLRTVAVEAGEEEGLRPDEAESRPDHVPLDDRTGLTDSRGVEPGLLGQLPLGGLEGRLPGLDATAGRLPEVVAVGGIAPAEQQDPAPRVDTENPCRGPV